jgi:hypothetical protein
MIGLSFMYVLGLSSSVHFAYKPLYIASGRTHREHRPFSYPRGYVCVAQQRVVYQESVSAGTCLQCRCIAMDFSDFTILAFGRHVTVYFHWKTWHCNRLHVLRTYRMYRAIIVSVDTVPSVLEFGQTSHQLSPSKQCWGPLAFASKRTGGSSFPRDNRAKLLIYLDIHGNYTCTPSVRLDQEYCTMMRWHFPLPL